MRVYSENSVFRFIFVTRLGCSWTLLTLLGLSMFSDTAKTNTTASTTA